jgi:hypothetical protein
MMIQLSLADGNSVLVNSDNVAYFQSAEDGTLVLFVGGASLHVMESYDAIAELCHPERPAPETESKTLTDANFDPNEGYGV